MLFARFRVEPLLVSIALLLFFATGEAAVAQQSVSKAEVELLVQEINQLSHQKKDLDRKLITLASRVQAAEVKRTKSDQRLQQLEVSIQKAEQKLAIRREKLSKLIAALQRFGYHLPPVLLSKPEAALKSIRSAQIVGGLLEEYYAEERRFSHDFERLTQYRRELEAEQKSLEAAKAQLEKEKKQIEHLAAEKRNQISTKTGLYERARRELEALGEAGAELSDLSTSLEESSIGSVLAEVRPAVALGIGTPFSQQKARLSLPVEGVVLRRFGESIDDKRKVKGTVIASRKGALVVAPHDAWVVYTQPFRKYGVIIFLSFEEGYTMLLSGLEKSYVKNGQFVLAGEPLGVMGKRAAAIATQLDISSAQPILYLELKKDKLWVDPAPWWVKR